MNIFFLDFNPTLAAEYHCDKHVVKMILESAQMISTVFDRYGKHENWMLKPCYQNHPCTLWAGDSRQNLFWLIELGIELNYEYTSRYKRKHKFFDLFFRFREIKKDFLPNSGFSSPALAMPEDSKILDNPVESYRKYYILHKSHIAKWKNKTPHWYPIH